MTTMDALDCGHEFDELVLLRYDELDGTRKADVASRLETCTSCREAYDELLALGRVVDLAPSLHPDLARAADARAGALAEIGRRSFRVAWRRLVDRWEQATSLSPWVPRLAFASVLVVSGYLYGRTTSPASTDAAGASVPGSTDPVLSHGQGSTPPPVLGVRDVAVDPATGEVTVDYAAVTDARVSGSLADESVRRVLADVILENEDLRGRLHALRAVVEANPSSPSVDDPLVAAIVEVLEGESSDALRHRSIAALGRIYSDSPLPRAVRTALLAQLSGDFGDGVRIAAIDVLTSRPMPRDSVTGADMRVLRHVAGSDPNSYVRLLANQTLNELDEAVPLEDASR